MRERLLLDFSPVNCKCESTSSMRAAAVVPSTSLWLAIRACMQLPGKCKITHLRLSQSSAEGCCETGSCMASRAGVDEHNERGFGDIPPYVPSACQVGVWHPAHTV